MTATSTQATPTETVTVCALTVGDVLVLSDGVTATVRDASLRWGQVIVRYDENLATDYPVFDRVMEVPTNFRVRRVL